VNGIEAKLRPHQIAPFRHLCGIFDSQQSAVDMSGTGTGKTFVASAIACALDRPTLVIGPKISKGTWQRAAAHFSDSFSVVGYEKLRAGNTPFGRWDNYKPGKEFFKCQCCQQVVDLDNFTPCWAHHAGIHCLETRKKSAQYGRFLFSPAVRFLVFDEVHRCNGLDSLNAELLLAAKYQGIPTLAISATAAHSPIHLRALGYLLDLHNDKKDLTAPHGFFHKVVRPSFLKWAGKYGCRYDQNFHGFHWFAGAERQKQIMAEIRSQIIPSRGVRVTAEEIPGFPERVITADLYDLEEPEKIEAAYAVIREARENLKRTSLADKNPDHPLNRILRARQDVELLKIPIATELAEDDLAKGFSIAFFVNFSGTIDALKKIYPDAGVIDGRAAKTRDEVVEKFQSNKCNKLVVNCEAGGVCLSLQDLDGEHPRMGYLFPNYSAVSAQQVFGRFQREGGKSRCYYRVILANKTGDVAIHRALVPKLNNLDALNDADLQPSNLSLT
jgi:hypothetical protein